MNRVSKYSLPCAALASLLTLGISLAHADSLVTTDGKVLFGSVTKTDTGYTVQTANGPVHLPVDKVKKILYDHPPAVPASATPAPAPTHPPSAKDLQMLKPLLEQGELALSGGELTDARDAFMDALTLDSQNALAARGLGYAYLKLGKAARAAPPLEVAALSAQPMDRTLTLALSASLVASHNPVRAVQVIKFYLDAHPRPLDEPMINALGIALSQVDRSATKGELVTSAVKLYAGLNDQLEANQTDKKRWGIDWLPPDEVTQKQKAFGDAQAKVDDASSKLQVANSKAQLAQKALKTAQSSNRDTRDARVSNAQAQLSAATSLQQTAQSAYDDASTALANSPAPNFPPEIPLEGVDLSLNLKPAAASDQPDKHLIRYAVAFAIAPDVLVTAASAVEDAINIQITTGQGKTSKAHMLRAHHSAGLALLKVDGAKFPCLRLANPVESAASGSITCLGFPEVELFNPAPKSMTVAAKSQDDGWTVRFDKSPRLPGGPLIQANAVVGVELADRDSDPAQIPAATLKSLLSLVQNSAQAEPPATDPSQAVVQVMAER